MTLKHFSVFCTVYSYLSFTEAAAHLGMTQPAVSIAVKDMEEHYGTVFFVRTRRRLTVTADGQKMYRFACAALRAAQAAEEGFSAECQRSAVRIGSNVTSASSFFSKLVFRYIREHPAQQVYFCVNNSSVIESGICNRELDIGMSDLPVRSDEVYAFPVTTEQMCLLCAPEFFGTIREPVTPERLITYPLLLSEAGSGSRECFDAALAGFGLRANALMESTNNTLLLSAARNGLGILVLPRNAARSQIKNGVLREIPVEGLNMEKRQYFILRKDTEPSDAALELIGKISALFPDSALARNFQKER